MNTSQRSFTEAVPLSLSSMAHMSFPLQEGVLDGLKQVLQHTLLSCVNYARAVHPPHRWTFDDLTTSRYAWAGCKGEQSPPRDLPWSLSKLSFQHQYSRHAWIYFRPAVVSLNRNITQEEEINNLRDWTNKNYILGRVSLLYASQELLTKGELDGTESIDDMPPIILYKVVVEYRSLPATGSQPAVQAEELSMLSFGGSVDDDVKLGALASLYDEQAKYVLEIYSVRGKKYKFDLMDSTLSDGTVPQLPSTNEHDPFVKSLCVTVTDHAMNSSSLSTVALPSSSNSNTSNQNDTNNDNNHDDNNNNNTNLDSADNSNNANNQQSNQNSHSNKTNTNGSSTCNSPSNNSSGNNNNNNNNSNDNNNQKYAVTRIHLTLDGNLRKGKNLENLPSFDYISKETIKSFLLLNPKPPKIVVSSPSGQNLLLDIKQAGRIYINGRYVTTWGNDPKIGDHHIALFGMDLRGVPFWHGQITDYEILKKVYAQLWQEILIDARLMELNLGKKLLHRLMYGTDNKNNTKSKKSKKKEKVKIESDDDGNDNKDDDDDDDDEDDSSSSSSNDNHINNSKSNKRQKVKQAPNTNIECLESHVLQSTKYDPVGIAAKALATKFAMEYGRNAFPCLAHEVGWCKNNLPHREPIVVPQRVINVLRRGGYFDINFTSNETWFTQCRNPTKRDHDGSFEKTLVQSSINLLKKYANCYDVKPAHIVFVPTSNIPYPQSEDAISKKSICRYNPPLKQYHIHEQLLQVSLTQYIQEQERGGGSGDNNNNQNNQNSSLTDEDIDKMRAFLLGMYVAQEHPDGSVLVRYLLRSRNESLFSKIS